jgi:large-conductance mechanosensitive channel
MVQYNTNMALGPEIIVRTAVGTVLGLALNSFFASIGNDVLKPIFSKKSFDKLEHQFIIEVYGIKINYGDLLGHFLTLVSVVLTIYVSITALEMYKIL